MKHVQSFIGVPRWLWTLVVPLGVAAMMWLATLLVPAAVLIALGSIGAVAYVASADSTPVVVEPEPRPVPTNSATMSAPRGDVIAGYCPPGSMTGAVWGTDIYTTDSSVCAAARHAGVVGAEGGRVEARIAPGCDSYRGTSRNGVSTNEWGTYPTSFYFDSVSDGTCPPLEDKTDVTIVTCGADGFDGTVWGSGPYTGDSSVCAAARHAGVIGPDGGVVQALHSPGCDAYPASRNNGVQTVSWGSYTSSFYFEQGGGRECQPAATSTGATKYKIFE